MSRHGIFIREQPTGISPPVTAESAMPVFIGTAPVHRGENPEAAVNRPILCYSYAEAVAALGYSDDWEKWTLCEAMYSQFRLYNVSPVVFINVFDNANMVATPVTEQLMIVDGRAELINELAVLPTVVVKADGTGNALELETDYTARYADGGIEIVTVLGGALDGLTSVTVEYRVVDVSSVDAKDVLGGVNIVTGKRTGVELIDEVFPRTRLVPGILAAPGWLDNEITAALAAKARSLNGLFRCMAVVDIPDDAGAKYSDIPVWKEANGLNSEHVIACWPRVTLGDRTFHLGTQLAGLMGRTDAANADIPFYSPSNQALSIDGMSWQGKEVMLDLEQANYLNDNGLVTALNWIGGWRAWGNETVTYPANADPKDRFIPIRRMFNWIANTIVLSHWSKISNPIRRVLIQNIETSVNMWLAGLTAQQQILGGRIEFRPEDNPDTAFIDGKITFRLFVTPPAPAKEIEFIMEYDTTYLSVLFAA